ncbi:hypothetical protein [uncultured Shimia sp.]|uniref:hypothetical protein n=1 Tax=uncultured Shimia sp. TaxID=573152 RepID=UPI0025D9B855|nr:hypothetical protein [uncultured Shimia sp.]
MGFAVELLRQVCHSCSLVHGNCCFFTTLKHERENGGGKLPCAESRFVSAAGAKENGEKRGCFAVVENEDWIKVSAIQKRMIKVWARLFGGV